MALITSDSTQGTLKSLQILRAVAATSVVYFHIGALPVFGSFGVDIFFIISGFVMSMVIANGQSASTFAISRLTRVIPLYWLFTTCLLVLASLKPELLNSTTADITNYLKSIFFIPYFKENGSLSPMLAVGWTLNYEMFFYVCIWLSIVTRRKIYIPLTLVLLTVPYIVFGKNSSSNVLRDFFGNSIIFELALGMLSYEIYKRNALRGLGRIPLLLISLLSYAFMVFAEVHSFEVERVYLFGIPSVALVLSVTALENVTFIKHSTLANAFANIGHSSYATYLSHFFVVEGMRKIVFPKLHLANPYTPSGVLLIVGLSLAVGHVIHRLCDKPMNKYLKLVARRYWPNHMYSRALNRPGF